MSPECHPDHRQAKSDERGEFTIADLDPGPWLIAATAPSSLNPPPSRSDERLGWAQTFYPGVTVPALAQALNAQPGGKQWGVDLKLAAAPIHHIRGRLTDFQGVPVPMAPVTIGKGFGPSLTQQTNRDGTFDFGTVVEGRWLLSAVLVQDSVKQRSAETVEVGKRDSEDVELRLSAPFSLGGKIVVEVPDGAPVAQRPDIDMGLVPVDALLSDGPSDFLVIRSDGNNLTVRDVYPGSYRVQFLTGSPVPYYLDSIRLGDQDALGTFSVVSGVLPLTIRLGLGGGTVRGTLEGCGSHHVFLVPQEHALRRDGFIRVTGCDRNGHFEFSAVRPGEYYSIALEKEPGSFADLSDDDVLIRGSKVIVRANESTSADLRLIER